MSLNVTECESAESAQARRWMSIVCTMYSLDSSTFVKGTGHNHRAAQKDIVETVAESSWWLVE